MLCILHHLKNYLTTYRSSCVCKRGSFCLSLVLDLLKILFSSTIAECLSVVQGTSTSTCKKKEDELKVMAQCPDLCCCHMLGRDASYNHTGFRQQMLRDFWYVSDIKHVYLVSLRNSCGNRCGNCNTFLMNNRKFKRKHSFENLL